MNARAPVLLASINGSDVGTLRDENGIWSFEYEHSWLQGTESFDLAPSLPRSAERITDGGSQRPVQWFFDNLLPEDAAREVVARDARIPAADAFGLLAYLGRESAGAITLLVPGDEPAPSGYQALSDQELHEKISRLPHHALSTGAPKRMSLAGGQHKLPVAIREGALLQPVGDAPSTHILKPDHKDTDYFPSSAANEFFVMRLAARMGLNVPAVEIRFVPDPVYLIERFDRARAGTLQQRLHAIDACQLLGFDRSFKYQQARSDALIRCIDLCQNRAQARRDIVAWTVFNAMVGNADAHLKNLSFLVTSRGIELAPFYDLLSTECYRGAADSVPRWPESQLTIPIGKAATFAAVTREELADFTEQLGSTRRVARRIADEYCEKLIPAADQLLQEFEGLQIPDPLVRASALRTLRLVRFTAIGVMVQRLRSSGR